MGLLEDDSPVSFSIFLPSWVQNKALSQLLASGRWSSDLSGADDRPLGFAIMQQKSKCQQVLTSMLPSRASDGGNLNPTLFMQENS